MLSTTKELIDQYYCSHNTKLKEILIKNNGLHQDQPFPTTWPVIVKNEN